VTLSASANPRWPPDISDGRLTPGCPLGAAVAFRWDRLEDRSDEGDPHQVTSSRDGSARVVQAALSP
jgi:hypothetical protein